METEFLNDLKTAYDTEEKIFESVSRVLGLLLAGTDLSQQRISELKITLDRLTRETAKHKQELGKVIREVERDDS